MVEVTRRGFIVSAAAAAEVGMLAGCVGGPGLMSGKAREKAFRFFNVAPFAPGREALLAQDMIELRARTGVDEILYCLTLHPEGLPAWKKVEFCAASYRALKRELAGSGVRLGILIQSILGHWPRTDKDIEPWTRSVNISGETIRFCPLDPGFRKYIFDTVALLAKEKPSFILGDDDIRSFSHQAECFCALHTAEFNRRAGTRFMPEEYRKAVAACKVGDRIYTEYDHLRRDMVNGVAALIRQAIDSVDPAIPAGTCMAYEEQRFAGEAAKAIAGAHPATMRICNATYMETSAKILPGNILRTQALRQYWKDIPCVLEESDTWPQNLWSKAAAGFHAKLCSSILSGINGSKLWFVNAHRGDIPITRNYTDILAENRGLYPALAEAVKGAELEGLVVPCHTSFPDWHPTHPWQSFQPSTSWGEVVCGAFGVPFRAAFDFGPDRIYSLAGEETVQRFSDAELRQLLSRRLLVDGPAALALTRRGFAADLGLTAAAGGPMFNDERLMDRPEVQLPIRQDGNVPVLEGLQPSARVFSNLVYVPFSGATTCTVVGPATVFFENARGGRVCVSVYHTGLGADQLNEARKDWFLGVLDWLNGAPVPFAVMNEQNVTALRLRLADGSSLLGVFNLNFDPMKTIDVRCADDVRTVRALDGDGVWRAVPCARRGRVLAVARPLACYGCAFLRFG